MVDVTVSAVCSGLSDDLDVAANLEPALGDVDLGSKSRRSTRARTRTRALRPSTHQHTHIR